MPCYPVAANPQGEPAFQASPDILSVNGLTLTLLTNNPDLSDPFHLDHSQAITCDQNHEYMAEQQADGGSLADRFVQHTDNNASPCTSPPLFLELIMSSILCRIPFAIAARNGEESTCSAKTVPIDVLNAEKGEISLTLAEIDLAKLMKGTPVERFGNSRLRENFIPMLVGRHITLCSLRHFAQPNILEAKTDGKSALLQF